VEDHCEALDVIAHRGEPGRTYVVGADGEHTNLEIVTAIASRLGRDASAIEHVPDRPGHDLRYALDSHRIRSELGWRSRMTFDDGLDKTVQWYVANRRWWEPILASSGIVSGASGAAGI
jgi:dTDP-glucose 4,6-dehydratase